MTDLVDTTEMYLRTILDLEEENIVPLRARISERLGHSGPTVSQTIARMERDGLVVVEGDRHLELTDDGRRKATHVMRKHRLAERLLADVIGLDWAYVHDEACRWEHVMSEQVERRLLEMLDHPTESPYGNPIPGLEELGDSPAARFMEGSSASSPWLRRAPPRWSFAASVNRCSLSRKCFRSCRMPGSCPAHPPLSPPTVRYVQIQVNGFGDGRRIAPRNREPHLRREVIHRLFTAKNTRSKMTFR